MPTVLVGLNEINMEYVKKYSEQGLLPTFSRLISENGLITTRSEEKYELIEPWIQWVTIHTGLRYDQHGINRLGDIVEKENIKQIFEILEEKGLRVGAVSPFNAVNRLNKPAFFMPDPWTKTDVSGGFLFCKLYESVRFFVNENSTRNKSFGAIFYLCLGLLKYSQKKDIIKYIKLLSKIKKPGNKARLLDRLVADVFIKEFKDKKPDFGVLFLNSGAHIQHHYLFNSAIYSGTAENPAWYCEKNHDPMINILEDYDKALERILELGVKLVVATGLHQVPHENTTFYWRPKNHLEFLNMLDIKNVSSVTPRMSRDFLIEFDSENDAKLACDELLRFTISEFEGPVFSVDNRGKSVFVEFIFSDDITPSKILSNQQNSIQIADIRKFVSFVAIKNGEHNGKGYVIADRRLRSETDIPLEQLSNIVIELALNDS